MESTHVPLVAEVMGAHYPITFTRRYVERVGSGAGDRLGAPAASRKNAEPTAPVLLVGSPSEHNWDMQGELTFRDELHLQQCFTLLNTETGQAVKDDEENFTIPNAFTVILIGETVSA